MWTRLISFLAIMVMHSVLISQGITSTVATEIEVLVFSVGMSVVVNCYRRYSLLNMLLAVGIACTAFGLSWFVLLVRVFCFGNGSTSGDDVQGMVFGAISAGGPELALGAVFLLAGKYFEDS